MSLATGTRVGHYEILTPIGQGGMGEVYRARDTKLKRDVALKVLPPAFANDPERMARFQREAEVLASLNHPNIAAIYGVEHDGSTQALAMEFVDGESPAPSNKAPLPFDDAWHIASQIAAALEYAHERGVIHRDLKPANVKVTPDGVVKLLDFGLAKAFQPSRDSNGAGLSPENSPTLTIGATEVGMILGTAAYMSPEQAKGKSVDKRADIWAFGVVLYELLAGERPFKGEDVGDILASVIKDTPDLTKIPPQARPLIKSCLEKDPKKRLRDIGDAGALLDRISGQQPAAAPTAFRRKPLAWISAAAAFAVALVVVSYTAYRSTRPAALKPLVSFDLDLGPDVPLDSIRGPAAVFSPDGTRLVYVSQGKLFIRKPDQVKAVELAGTEGAAAPFFSPDGHWVAFFAGAKLKKIAVEGGSPVVLCDAAVGFGGSWGADGNIIASLNTVGPLETIPSTGGAPSPFTQMAPGEDHHNWPQILPGGRAVLFTSNAGMYFGGANVEILSLKDRSRKVLQRGAFFGRYVATSNGAGYLLYISNGTLYGVAFDQDAGEVRGTPVPVLQQVASSLQFGAAQFDVSGNGMLIYQTGDSGGDQVNIQWLDSGGKLQPLLAKSGYYVRPRFSPDGLRLAVEVREGPARDVWIYEWQRNIMTRLTFTADSENPIWSPDGLRIFFKTPEGISWIPSDGAGKPQLLIPGKNPPYPWSFLPDGRRLAWQEAEASATALWTSPLEIEEGAVRTGKPELFLNASFDRRHPTFSPDGRWLAYDSNESGTYQIYVRAFPDVGGKWQVSSRSGTYPVWSRSGRELYFRADDNRIMAAAYSVKNGAFLADPPRVWSEKKLADFGVIGNASYDLAPDGKRIAALMPVEKPEARESQRHATLLLNFFDELQRRVPAK